MSAGENSKLFVAASVGFDEMNIVVGFSPKFEYKSYHNSNK